MILLDRDFADQFIRCAEGALADGVIDDIAIVSGYRSSREQAHLHRRFSAGLSDLPVAEPGKSYHNYGVAVDVQVSPENALDEFGAYAEDCGLRWGGAFGDPVHFDAGRTLTLVDAKRRFKKNKLVRVEGG